MSATVEWQVEYFFFFFFLEKVEYILVLPIPIKRTVRKKNTNFNLEEYDCLESFSGNLIIYHVQMQKSLFKFLFFFLKKKYK